MKFTLVKFVVTRVKRLLRLLTRTLVVMNSSSRLISPELIFSLIASPMSPSVWYTSAVSMCRYPASMAARTAFFTSPEPGSPCSITK